MPIRVRQVSSLISEEEAKAREFLEQCPNKGSGCFADHPKALVDVKHGLGDAAIRARGQRIVVAALEAGRDGTPLAEATWTDVTIEAADEPGHVKLGDGETKTMEETHGHFIPTSVACAYVCGTQFGTCPIAQSGKGE